MADTAMDAVAALLSALLGQNQPLMLEFRKLLQYTSYVTDIPAALLSVRFPWHEGFSAHKK